MAGTGDGELSPGTCCEGYTPTHLPYRPVEELEGNNKDKTIVASHPLQADCLYLSLETTFTQT